MEGREDRLPEGTPGSVEGDRSPTSSELLFVAEDELQEYIANSPHSTLHVSQPTAVAREVGVPPQVGSADVVVVERDGTITIVECKLAANPGSHGSVIGQALSYAAGLATLDYEGFKRRFEARDGSLTRPFEEDADWKEAAFRRAINHKLTAGVFRLVIAVDRLSPALKQALAFLENRQPGGVQISSIELCPDMPKVGRHERRRVLIDRISARSGSRAAQTAEVLLGWAKEEPLVDDDYPKFDAVIKTPIHTCFGLCACQTCGYRSTRSAPSSIHGMARQARS